MLLNIRQFIFHTSCFKLICVKLGIDWTYAPYSQTFCTAISSRTAMGVYSYAASTCRSAVWKETSSIAKLTNDALVSTAIADIRLMVNLVCLFMKTHLLALL